MVIDLHGPDRDIILLCIMYAYGIHIIRYNRMKMIVP